MYRGTAINCTFTNNKGLLGGAGYDIKAINCTFIANTAEYGGGAIYKNIAVTSHFENNSIINPDGYDDPNNAIYEVFAVNCTFVNNGWEDSQVVSESHLLADDYTAYAIKPGNANIHLIGDGTEIYDIGITIGIYKDGELIKTENFVSGRSWTPRLAPGDYTATAYINGIPEIRSANFSIKIKKTPSEVYANDITIHYNATDPTLAIRLVENVTGSYLPIIAQLIIDLDGNISNYTTNSDGYIYLPLNNLSIDTHIATIRFAGNELYEASNKTVRITVTKIPIRVECEDPIIIKYKGTDPIMVRLVSIDGVPVSAAGIWMDLIDEDYFITNSNGYARIDPRYLQKLAAGNYTTRIYFEGFTYDVFGPGEKTVTLVVEKQNTTLSSNDVVTVFNSDDKIVATITNEQGNPVSGVELTIDLFPGETFTTNAKGQVEIPTNTLAAGEYDVKFDFAGNENYTASNSKAHIIINKAYTILYADNITTSLDDEGYLTISLKDSQKRPIANEKILVLLKGIEEKTTDENGQVKISTNGLETNKYTVFILYNGNNNYLASNTTGMINITKGNPNIYVENSGVAMGETATINITAEDKNGNPISGIAKISVDGLFEYYTKIGENGKGQLTLTADFYPGAYRLNAIFLANDNFNEAHDDSVFVVYEPRKINLNITANDAIYGEDTILNIRVTDSRGVPVSIRRVNIAVGDKEAQEYEIIWNEVNLGKVDVGSTLIQVSYTGYYDPTTANIIATVKPATPNLIVTGSTVELGNEAIVTIQSKDKDNNPIKGTVLVTVDWVGGVAKDFVELDEEGKGIAKLQNIAIPGNYSIIAKFIGNGNYTSNVNDTEKIRVTEPSSITFEAEVNADFTGIIITDAKKADTGETVSGTINGVLIKGQDIEELPTITLVNGQGIIPLPADLTSGYYNVKLILETDDGDYAFNSLDFTKSIKDTIINVTTMDIKYGEESVINFILSDIDGNKLNGTIFALIGNQNQPVEVINGAGTFRTNLTAGNYTVIAAYLGNEKYAASSAVSNFNVAKLGTQILYENMETTAVSSADPKTGEWFTWTLTDSDGKPMANVPMQIGFNGVVYTYEKDGIITDENGTARLQINLGYKGVYTFAICFLGDENYNASFVLSKITVKEQTPTLTVPNKAYDASAKTKSLTATFKSDKGTPIAGKWVSFTVNGKVYKAKTDDKGVATVNISISAKGSYSFTAKFAGDSTYKAVTKSATLKIN